VRRSLAAGGFIDWKKADHMSKRTNSGVAAIVRQVRDFGVGNLFFIAVMLVGLWVFFDQPTKADSGTRFGMVLFMVLAAFGLVAFKKRLRLLYGLVEMGFASYLAWRTIGEFKDGAPFFNLIALAGSFYLMARGAANVDEGMDDERVKKWFAS
jgi:hypothetical protein